MSGGDGWALIRMLASFGVESEMEYHISAVCVCVHVHIYSATMHL